MMKLIVGEHYSGKSSKALEFAKNKDKVLYLSLDNDWSVKNTIESNPNITFKHINSCFLIDIEFSIIGSTYDTIIVDSINFIKQIQNVNHELSLKNTIKGLEYIHYTYGTNIIATYSILSRVDKMKTDVGKLFENNNDWELIETKIKKKNSKLTITTKDGQTTLKI